VLWSVVLAGKGEKQKAKRHTKSVYCSKTSNEEGERNEQKRACDSEERKVMSMER
jgi:hypothetical protein